MAEILRVAYGPIRKLAVEGGFAWKEIRAGTYRAAGPTAIGTAYIYRHELIAFISVHAEALKVFVEQAFHNPVLVRIIDIISKFGAVQ